MTPYIRDRKPHHRASIWPILRTYRFTSIAASPANNSRQGEETGSGKVSK